MKQKTRSYLKSQFKDRAALLVRIIWLVIIVTIMMLGFVLPLISELNGTQPEGKFYLG